MQNGPFLALFFRSKPVQSETLMASSLFFRSNAVQSRAEVVSFPDHTRSLTVVHRISLRCNDKHNAEMSGKPKQMSLIKQVLQLKKLGESNRGIARKLPINKGTVNDYIRQLQANSWDIDELLNLDDPELERCSMPARRHIRTREWNSFSNFCLNTRSSLQTRNHTSPDRYCLMNTACHTQTATASRSFTII